MRQKYRQDHPQTRKMVLRIDVVELGDVAAPVLAPPGIEGAVVEVESETEYETTSEDAD